MLALYLRHIGRLAYLLSLPGRPDSTPDIFGSTQPTCTGSNCIHTCPLIRTFFSTDLQTGLKQDRTKRNPHSESANSQHTGQQHTRKRFLSSHAFQLPSSFPGPIRTVNPILMMFYPQSSRVILAVRWSVLG